MSERVIRLVVDHSCDMAQVELDGLVVMNGNFWDFNPNCIGLHDYGDFSGHWGLVRAIETHLLRNGFSVKIEEPDDYHFNGNDWV